MKTVAPKQDSFELGTPVVYHSIDFNGNTVEQSGEIVYNREVYRDFYKSGPTFQPNTIKGISLYRDKNYSGPSQRFVVPEWENVETFAEAKKRTYKGETFKITK